MLEAKAFLNNLKSFPIAYFSDSERRENDEGLEFSAIGKTYITQQAILKEVQCFLTFMNDLSYK